MEIIFIYAIGRNCFNVITLYISNRGHSASTAGATPHLATRCRQSTAEQLAAPHVSPDAAEEGFLLDAFGRGRL